MQIKSSLFNLKNKRELAVAFLLFLVLFAYSQSTTIKCLLVNEFNGAVTINWEGPSNTDFYKIYRSSSLNGTFVEIHTTQDGNINTYEDSEISAAVASYSYYVEAFSNGSSIGLSEINRTIFLENDFDDNFTISLFWEDPGYTPITPYEVWVSVENEPYILERVTFSTNIFDTLRICKENRLYQIRSFSNGCYHKSNTSGKLFNNSVKPDRIIPVNLNVDFNTGFINISWERAPESMFDFLSYNVWIMNATNASTSEPLANIYGIETTELTFFNQDICDTSLTFSVTVIDTCGNQSNYDIEDYYLRNTHLKDAVYDICNDACELSWDSIFGWYGKEIGGVRIFERKGSGPFEQVGQAGPSDTSYTLFGFERGVEYSFYIEAFSTDNTRTSASCLKKIVGKRPVNTEYTWLRQVSVVDGEVKLKWQVDSIAYIPFYLISRSSDGIDFSILDTLEGNSDTILYYTDNTSRYFSSSQFYYIEPLDSCLNVGEPSNTSNSILSNVSSIKDGEAIIEWNEYAKMDSMLGYNVFRVIDTLIYPNPIAELLPNQFTYTDYYGNSVPLSSRVGYFVEAYGYFNDNILTPDTARSNVNYLAKATNLFMPSGFKPLGNVNSIFKPIYTGIKNTNYSFKIYNKWGILLFESLQPIVGWDGTYKDKLVAADSYVYIVEYETLNGKKKRNNGVFFVLY
jgi:gliding motility-associated-like protein